MPELSILVPAYNYPRGVERILKALHPIPPEVELIIFDDSTDFAVHKLTEHYTMANFRYQKNVPAKGAISNWNSLLDAANGDFLMLLHHDELPLGENFLLRVLRALRETRKDVLMLDVHLVDASLSFVRMHVPRIMRDLVIRYIPGYLFCRNVIGPTASLIVRKNVCPRFDTSLRWLVDVDLYYRLRQNTDSWGALRGLRMASVQGDHETITATLQNKLTRIEEEERSRLREHHRTASFWIDLRRKPTIALLEAAAWNSFRTIQFGSAALMKRMGARG